MESAISEPELDISPRAPRRSGRHRASRVFKDYVHPGSVSGTMEEPRQTRRFLSRREAASKTKSRLCAGASESELNQAQDLEKVNNVPRYHSPHTLHTSNQASLTV